MPQHFSSLPENEEINELFKLWESAYGVADPDINEMRRISEPSIRARIRHLESDTQGNLKGVIVNTESKKPEKRKNRYQILKESVKPETEKEESYEIRRKISWNK